VFELTNLVLLNANETLKELLVATCCAMFFKFVVVLAATTWLSCPPLTNEGTMLISKMADKLQLEIYRGLQFDQNLIITTYFNRKYRLAVKYIYKPLLALLMKFDLLQMPPCLFVIEWLRILMWRGPWE